MIHDPHRQTLTAALSVSHPAFALLDDDDRAQRVSRWGRVIARWPSPAPAPPCRCWRRRSPTRPRPDASGSEAHGRRDGGWAATQYQTLLDQVRLDSSTHRTTISLSLDIRAAARAVKAAGGGVTRRGRGPARGHGQPRRRPSPGRPPSASWLAEPDLAAIVRAAYDPAIVLDPAVDPGRQPGPRRAGCRLASHWDRLRHDSAWSSVLWISEWPRIDVAAGLPAPDRLRARACAGRSRIIARPLPTDVALRQIRKEKTEAVADSAQKARVGQLADLSDAQEYDDLLDAGAVGDLRPHRRRVHRAHHRDGAHLDRPRGGDRHDQPGGRPGDLRGAPAVRPASCRASSAAALPLARTTF